jgi:aspartyl/asparaginyl-tRNA synthetase|tara:strand:+ start:16117 stop:16947 length:831 start_codon:yes stop_codon:yes gene_type:complete
MTQLIDPQKFTDTVGLLRSFFLSKGFLEVHTQNRLSILAACEDPFNVATYNYAGETWPLPQTGQMWLEHELLTKPSSQGFFCVSTSYRQEPNAIPGRHDIIFPMFEFEMPGDINDLKAMEYELCEYLGFKEPTEKTYREWQQHYGLHINSELTAQHELAMQNFFGPTLITDFPEMTSPFWNMSRNEGGETSKKIDVILGGMETIGSAERSCDVDMMRDTFYSITEGAYSKLLFELFGKERVEAELEEFFKFDFFPRVGGGIGITRMIPALQAIETI